jgi:hypothetical protein
VPLTGKAKTDYQREYMRRRRAAVTDGGKLRHGHDDDDGYVEFKSTNQRNTHYFPEFVEEGFRAAAECRKRLNDLTVKRGWVADVRRLTKEWARIAERLEKR